MFDAELLIGAPELRVLVPQNGRRQEGCIDGTRLANGHGTDRYAPRHLDDAQKRVHAVERLGLHRHAQNRQHRLAGTHARQMSCTPGSSDNHLKAPARSRRRIFKEEVRSPMSADHRGLKWHTQGRQLASRRLHRLPIGLGTHDDADQRRTHKDRE